MTERDMPPPERPGSRRQEGEQTHLREDAGMTEGPLEGDGSAEHVREDAGRPGVEPEYEEDDKGLLDKAKDKLTGR